MVGQQIGQNLAYVNWVVLTGLAVGTFAAVLVGRFRTGATKGFLTFGSLCAAVFGFLAYLADTALPVSSAGSPITPDPAFDQPRGLALAAFAILGLAYTIALARGGRAPLLAGLTLPGGRLVMSGILESQADAVRGVYREWFEFDAPAAEEGWVRLCGEKK